MIYRTTALTSTIMYCAWSAFHTLCYSLECFHEMHLRQYAPNEAARVSLRT
jgi:hypothetical protein